MDLHILIRFLRFVYPAIYELPYPMSVPEVGKRDSEPNDVICKYYICEQIHPTFVFTFIVHKKLIFYLHNSQKCCTFALDFYKDRNQQLIVIKH